MSDMKPKSNSKRRRVLMFGGVLAVALICGWFYTMSGRFIDTDNAYAKSAKIMLTPEVAGRIVSVAVQDNQLVHAGDPLFDIDPKAYEVAIRQAKADAANAYAQIEEYKAQYKQKQGEIAKAKVELVYAEKEFKRRQNLVKQGAVAESEFNDMQRQRDADIEEVASLQAEMKGIRAALADNPEINPDDHPLMKKAYAVIAEAELDLARTHVIAPVDGIIGTAPRQGDYARAGVPLVNFVATQHVWIEANYKETELTNMKIGQPVSIEVDAYPGLELKGHVESISPATGSEFSLLPAQNATGNWVKVVQRVGVRIAVDSTEHAEILRSGMSTHVSVDIGYYPHGFMQSAVADQR